MKSSKFRKLISIEEKNLNTFNTMTGSVERLDQSTLNPLLEHPETDKSQPGIESRPPRRRRRALGTSTWLPQCKTLIHSAKSESRQM
jgi:hypothetical protein